MNVLVLGGTRFVGLALAQRLIGAGARVTVLHRGQTGEAPAGAVTVAGDRADDDGLAGLGQARFDAVVDMSAYFSAWTKRSVEALSGRVAHYVFISSGAVYRPSAELPWPESTPFGPIPIWGRYGEEKVASERALWEAYGEGRFGVTCFRFPFILGPGNFADRESFVFGRLEAGRPVLLPDGGGALNQFVYIDDVVNALISALQRPDVVVGSAYNCTYGRAITNRGWVELCGAVAGIEPHVVPIDETEAGVASATVDLADIVFPYPATHYVLDGTKLTRELGVEITTGNRRMLEEYYAWWQARPGRNLRRYAREDRALAALGLQTA
jgi:2'-hydroxyisoflavone reductase